jgi:hypothetical protein
MTELVRYCKGCDKTFKVPYVNGMKLPDNCLRCKGLSLETEVSGSVGNKNKSESS